MSKFMFHSGLLMSIFLASFLCTSTASAQSAGPKTTMVQNAAEMEKDISLLLPSVQKVRDAAARQILTDYFNACLATSRNVIRAGVNMSDTQFQKFEKEYLAAEQTVSKLNCDAATSELAKAVCQCKAEGKLITQCVADKAPPGGY